MRDKGTFSREACSCLQALVEFSARLDLFLKRGNTLPAFHTDLLQLSDDMRYVIRSETAQCDEIELFECRRTLTESRRRCNELLRENASLRAARASPNDFKGGNGLSPVSTRADSEEEEDSSWIRDRIRLLKRNLAERNSKMEELQCTHEAEVKKIESLHKREVQSLRDALASTTRILERWKSIYSDDVSRLKEALTRKAIGQRCTTLQKSRSSERLSKACMS